MGLLRKFVKNENRRFQVLLLLDIIFILLLGFLAYTTMTYCTLISTPSGYIPASMMNMSSFHSVSTIPINCSCNNLTIIINNCTSGQENGSSVNEIG